MSKMVEREATGRTPPRVAILIVNGFDKRGHWGRYDSAEAQNHPWIDICLQQIERYSGGWNYDVIVYDNSHLRLHRELMQAYPRVSVLPGAGAAGFGRLADLVPLRRVGNLFEQKHPEALDHLLTRVASDVDYIVTLDSDSFPAREGWLDALVSECENGAALAGVYRDEMAPAIRPFVHVSGLCARVADLRALDVSFSRGMGQDVGQNITEAFVHAGRRVAPLKRSNKVNFHFLIGGLYGDVVYHHGAGSRRAKFWTSTDLEADERVSTILRDAAFGDLDHLLEVLRGETPNDLGLAPV